MSILSKSKGEQKVPKSCLLETRSFLRNVHAKNDIIGNALPSIRKQDIYVLLPGKLTYKVKLIITLMIMIET